MSEAGALASASEAQGEGGKLPVAVEGDVAKDKERVPGTGPLNAAFNHEAIGLSEVEPILGFEEQSFGFTSGGDGCPVLLDLCRNRFDGWSLFPGEIHDRLEDSPLIVLCIAVGEINQ